MKQTEEQKDKTIEYYFEALDKCRELINDNCPVSNREFKTKLEEMTVNLELLNMR
jgi:hypothetical protein